MAKLIDICVDYNIFGVVKLIGERPDDI